MKKNLLDILACPMCKKHPLELIEIKSKGDEIVEGVIYCTSCERYYLIIEEIPVMLPDELRDKKQENEFLKKIKIHFLKKLSNKESLGICDKIG